MKCPVFSLAWLPLRSTGLTRPTSTIVSSVAERLCVPKTLFSTPLLASGPQDVAKQNLASPLCFSLFCCLSHGSRGVALRHIAKHSKTEKCCCVVCYLLLFRYLLQATTAENIVTHSKRELCCYVLLDFVMFLLCFAGAMFSLDFAMFLLCFARFCYVLLGCAMFLPGFAVIV